MRSFVFYLKSAKSCVRVSIRCLVYEFQPVLPSWITITCTWFNSIHIHAFSIPIPHRDRKSNHVMSRQNPFCGCSLMHWTRRTLSNIGTASSSLEHASWAAVRMLHKYSCCISTVVHRNSETCNVLQSQIMPVSFLDCTYTDFF